MKENPYHALRWDDLASWSGLAVLDRGKHYRDRVTELTSSESHLLAVVKGGESYLTHVWLGDDGLRHRCSCPYWAPCKHAVAVVLVYLDHVRSGKAVPEITPDEMEGIIEAHGMSVMPDENPYNPIDPEKIRAALEKMPVEEIIGWATDIIADQPALLGNLPSGLRPENLRPDNSVISDRQIARLRQEIRITAKERFYHDEWHDPFGDDDDGPDYSSIEQQFRHLMDGGHVETLIDLGEELFTLGSRQVDESDMNQDSLDGLIGCLTVLVEAMQASGRPAPERVIWFWDLQLKDWGDLLGNIPLPARDGEMTRPDWLGVAQAFMGRLASPSGRKEGDRHQEYNRRKVLDCAVKALVAADEDDRAIELMISELPYCRNHIELVHHLLEKGDCRLAGHWALAGFQQTVDESPGIARKLAEMLQEIARKQEDWPMVAALAAEFFFHAPDTLCYQQVHEACGNSGHWKEVRPALLHFLETGKRPRPAADWPLPETGLEFPDRSRPGDFPDYSGLISAALYEEHPDDAVRWYLQAPSGQASNTDSIARAVRATHPEVSLRIWRDKVESLIAVVKPRAYRDAMRPLEDMRSLMQEIGRDGDYREYVCALRERHRAKRKLMEELDFLERKSRKILDG